MKVSERYLETLILAVVHSGRHQDNRVGFSIYVSDHAGPQVDYVLAVPPSLAEHCQRNNRLLDMHFGNWDGTSEGKAEKQVREGLARMKERCFRGRVLSYGTMIDAHHAEELAVEAAVSGFRWSTFDPEQHVAEFLRQHYGDV